MGVIDTALVEISRDYKAPFIVKKESEAQMLIITLSYSEIYSLEDLPETIAGSRVICYDFPSSLLPKNFKPLLVIDLGYRNLE
jgi:hypothetical protein